MSCCLLATIPSDVGVLLTKVPAPAVAGSNVGACSSVSTKTSEPFSSLTGFYFDSEDSDADEDWSHCLLGWCQRWGMNGIHLILWMAMLFSLFCIWL